MRNLVLNPMKKDANFFHRVTSLSQSDIKLDKDGQEMAMYLELMNLFQIPYHVALSLKSKIRSIKQINRVFSEHRVDLVPQFLILRRRSQTLCEHSPRDGDTWNFSN